MIVAGYPALMKKFIASNPGLASRINKYTEFHDYSKEELYQIFEYICEVSSYKIDADGQQALREYIEKLVGNKDETFDNARKIRNVFE